MQDVQETVLNSAARIEADPRWQAVVERDASFDGTFYYAVKTTGVYCRPSCASRLARPENVAFYDQLKDAEGAGYRPCRRCRPNEAGLRERQAFVVAAACRTIEASDEQPSLSELARTSGMSTYYFHRMFKAVTGVTPKAYADAWRTRAVQDGLSRGERSVSETIYEAGFNSSGRFYAAAEGMLGMTPKEYQSGGRNALIHFAVGETALGSVLVARSEKGICAIFMGDDPETLVYDLQDRFPNAGLVGGDPAFESVVAQVLGFVENPSRGLDLPLDVRGTLFQQRVWDVMRRIPAGKTMSYAQVAQTLGTPNAVRAVAGACAANALAVAIPCHRVIKSDGALSGYRWGIERKRELLRREASACSIGAERAL